jgi:ATP-binding cassette subfamily C protein LapB
MTLFSSGEKALRPLRPGTPVVSSTKEPGNTLDRDPLLRCLIWVLDFYGTEKSPQALLQGWPVGERVSPLLAKKTLEELGYSTSLVARQPTALSSYLLPAILLMKDGGAVVLLRRIDPSEDPSLLGPVFEVMLPDVEQGPVTLPQDELLHDYSGHCLLIKPRAKEDHRGDERVEARPGHWLWGTIWNYRRYYRSAILAALLINLLTLAGSLFTMNVYDRVVPLQAYTSLWSLALGTVVAMVFEVFARQLRSYLIDMAGKKADLQLGSLLFRQALSIRLEHKPVSAGAFANQMREFESVRDFSTSATLAVLTDLPFIFLFVYIVYLIGGALAWVPAVMIPMVVLICVALQFPLNQAMNMHLREASIKHGVLIESIEGMETLRAVSAEGFMQKRWEDASALTSLSAMKSRHWSSMAGHFVQWVQQIETVVLVVWGVYLIHAGQLSQGALIGSVMLASRALAPLGQVVGLAARYQQAKAALVSLNKLMAMPTIRDTERNYLPRSQLDGRLDLQGVKFSYPAPKGVTPPVVLSGVDLHIHPGEHVAVLGRIGSGKSTLLRLMAGFFRPIEGQILVDGIDVNQIEPADFRAQVGFVAQDVRLFHGTLRENIVLNRPHVSSEDFLKVARLTGLDSMAAAHPLGFDLPIGEMGHGLSGGQRQLVALARCLITRPQILLMDEPTSSMDAQAEQLFIQHLKTLIPGLTLVVVTHRPTVLELVDRLVVLDQTKVVADGPKAVVLAQLSGGV